SLAEAHSAKAGVPTILFRPKSSLSNKYPELKRSPGDTTAGARQSRITVAPLCRALTTRSSNRDGSKGEGDEGPPPSKSTWETPPSKASPRRRLAKAQRKYIGEIT